MDKPEAPRPEERQQRWRALERDVAHLLDGMITPGSGSGFQKGDIRSMLFLAECKYRWEWNEKEGYVLTLDSKWLETIYHHSLKLDLVPLLALEWGDGTRAALVPEELAHEQLERLGYSRLVQEKKNPRLPVKLVEVGWSLVLPSLRIPIRNWELISLQEVVQLRRKMEQVVPS